MKTDKLKSIKKKITYKIDDFFSKNLFNQIIVLIACGFIAVFIVGIIVRILFRDNSLDWSIWQILMHFIDQGTITADSTDNKYYILVMLIVTFAGMAFVSTMIGLIGNSISGKIADVQQGHSIVEEDGHYVILGHNENTIGLSREVEFILRKKQGNKVLVIADDLPKEEMEHTAMNAQVNFDESDSLDLRNTERTDKIKVIYRSGSPKNTSTFSMCAVSRAAAVIVNGRDDNETIKILLALADYLRKCNAYIESESMPSVVAVIYELNNLKAAKIAAGIYHEKDIRHSLLPNENKVRIVFGSEILAGIFNSSFQYPETSIAYFGIILNRIATLSLRQLQTEKDRYNNAEMIGKSIKAISEETNGGIPLGWLRSIPKKQPVCMLNPENCETFTKNDQLILLSSNNASDFTIREKPEPVGIGVSQNAEEKIKINTLCIGRKANSEHLKQRIAMAENIGQVHSISENPYNWPNVLNELESHPFWFDPADERHLTTIFIFGCYDLPKEESDNGVIVILLNLRNYLKKHKIHINLFSEMNYPKNQVLLQSTGTGDFILSPQIINGYLVHIAEAPDKYYIYNKLFKNQELQLKVRPFSRYIDTSEPFNFEGIRREIQKHTDKTGVPAIPLGWIKLCFDGSRDHQLVLDPQPDECAAIFHDDKHTGFSEYRLILISVPGNL